MGEFEAIRIFMDNDIKNLNAVTASAMLHAHPHIVHLRDRWGWTPLMMAALFANINVMKVLVQHGADVNATSYPGEDCANDSAKEMTPLMILVGAGGSKLKILSGVRYLLKKGANPNVRNARNECAADICAYWIHNRKYIGATDFEVQQYQHMIGLLQEK